MEFLAWLVLGCALVLWFFGGRLLRGSVSGKARVVDGDGLRIEGREIRLAEIDAPEWRQPAVDGDGIKINHGAVAKQALVAKIAGRPVQVRLSGRDRYGRCLGYAVCGGEDLNAWLVRNGHAVSAFGRRYLAEEEAARRDRIGMWGFREAVHPVSHKKGAPVDIWRGKGLGGLPLVGRLFR